LSSFEATSSAISCWCALFGDSIAAQLWQRLRFNDLMKTALAEIAASRLRTAVTSQYAPTNAGNIRFS